MKILVVDDNQAMRRIIKRTLRKTGLPLDEVKGVRDGKEALEMIDEFEPDIITSDFGTNRMEGSQFLRKVKDFYGSSIIFGFITSQVSDKLKQKVADTGASFYLTKPFSVSGLRAVLEDYT